MIITRKASFVLRVMQYLLSSIGSKKTASASSSRVEVTVRRSKNEIARYDIRKNTSKVATIVTVLVIANQRGNAFSVAVHGL